MSTKSKRFIYQTATWLVPTTVPLQEAFNRAIRGRSEAQLDQPVSQNATATTGQWRKLIRHHTGQGVRFGKLVEFTHGQRQETVKLRRRASDDPEGSVAPPAGEEFSDGDLYFCIEGDHVIIAQSKGLRIAQLESYLNWLLTPPTGSGNYISLSSVPPLQARQILARNTPKSVTFTRDLELGSQAGQHTATAIVSDDSNSIGKVEQALQNLLGISRTREMLPAIDNVQGRIHTSITLSWNRRLGGDRPDDFLDGLGRVALRQLDEDESMGIEIEIPGGTKLTRGKLSLAESVAFPLVDGVVPAQEVFARMLRYLQQLRERGEIVD